MDLSYARRFSQQLDILQVTPAYSPSIGGVETCTREVSWHMARSAGSVRVLTADPSHRLPSHENVDGIKVTRVRAWPRDGDQRWAPGIAGEVRRNRPSVVHVQCYQTFVAPIAMAAAAQSRTPYVLTFHGGGHSGSVRHRIRRRQLEVLRPLLARAGALIATAEWEIDHYSSMLGLATERFRLIPNGGDLPTPREPPSRRLGTLIASVGRAERYKGHHRVLAALPHVLKEIPDARLWIAGEGPYAPELMRMAYELGIADRLEIESIRDREAYADRLARASVVTLFSDHETNPMAALEAIQLGVPTLVANNSGLAELAQKGLARQISLADDDRSHAREIVGMIRDPPPRPTATIQVSSWRECADALLALYREVHARPARA